ncbi:MAG TPA: methylated-DNA--[protein]-cysteine S-methyltransferase [bacterium]|nr:methylated-DNA--[protein]-cysteine S-methyltransferase [bacterium]
MSLYKSRIASPVGPLILVGNRSHVTAIQFLDTSSKLPPDLSFAPPEKHLSQENPLLEARRELEAYFRGALTLFSTPLAPSGTPFQHRVWEALRKIPYGETASYGEIARWIDTPDASRAVGAACRANPVTIMIPCHRVVGKGGNLTGYAGGLRIKEFLLRLEQQDFRAPAGPENRESRRDRNP